VCRSFWGGRGFVVLLRRWLVERSFAWLLLGYGMPYPYLFVLVLGCVVCGGRGLDMVGRDTASDAVYCKGWFLNTLSAVITLGTEHEQNDTHGHAEPVGR